MGFIWTFIMTSLLTTNALAILNEKRFLKNYGLHQIESSDGPPSVKNQVAGLLTAVQYTRVLLIPINIIAIPMHSMSTDARPSVRFNMLSVFISFVLFFNISSMSMKAYFTERFPWSIPAPTIPEIDLWIDNFTLFESIGLNISAIYFNDTYINASLVNSYIHDVDQETELRYYVRNLTSPIPLDRCDVDFIQTLPLAMCFTPRVLDLLCQLASSQINTTVSNGRCQHSYFLQFYLSPACILYRSLDPTTPTLVTFIHVYRMSRFYASTLWLKFIVRLLITFYLIYQMWIKYYCHYINLVINLKQYGHQHLHLESPMHATTYEIILGDPTSLVLTNPLVSLLLALDFFFSPDSVSVAMVRICQFDDLYMWSTGCLYFSRLIWFVYLGLNLMDKLLKRLKWENRVLPIDPTLAAIAVGIGSGPFFGSVAQTPILKFYAWLFSAIVPSEYAASAQDGFFCLLVVSILVTNNCVSTCFFMKYLQDRKIKPTNSPVSIAVETKVPPLSLINQSNELTTRIFASMTNNDAKHKILLALIRRAQSIRPSLDSLRSTPMRIVGGTLYLLCSMNPRYIKHPTMSQRGADCYVVCYNEANRPFKRLRLSLVSCLDRQLGDDEIAIAEGTPLDTFAVSLFEFDKDKGKIILHRGARKCQWCA